MNLILNISVFVVGIVLAYLIVKTRTNSLRNHEERERRREDFEAEIERRRAIEHANGEKTGYLFGYHPGTPCRRAPDKNK